MKNSISFST